MRLEARDAFPPGLLQNPVHLLAEVVLHFQNQAAIVEAFVSNACARASLGAKEVITPRPVLDTSTATLFSPMTLERTRCTSRSRISREHGQHRRSADAVEVGFARHGWFVAPACRPRQIHLHVSSVPALPHRVNNEFAIYVRGLRKSYDGFEAVKGIDFEVRPGEVFGLLGPNGAGKTTTVEILEGLRPRSGGEVKVLDLDPELQTKRLKDRIGIALQATNLPDKITVREAVNLFAAFYTRTVEGEPLLKRLQLWDKKMRRTLRSLADSSNGWRSPSR